MSIRPQPILMVVGYVQKQQNQLLNVVQLGHKNFKLIKKRLVYLRQMNNLSLLTACAVF